MKNNIKNMQTQILSKAWSTLKKVSYDYLRKDGVWERQEREAYDRGNGATVLLYNPETNKILLTRQFRLPTYLNGNSSGLMIETCAGKLDELDPSDCIIKETLEETGYQINPPTKIFQLYMSPGSVTELIHFFIAPYSNDMKVSTGGGNSHEQENIDVLELSFNDAFAMIDRGEIKDGKTIILLQYAKINNLL